MRNRILTLAGLAALAATLLGTTAASAQSIIGDPGVYLSSTPTLTLGAPNAAFTKDISGRAVVLKNCLGDGNCASTGNLRVTEDFDLVTAVAPSTWTGTELRLHGTQWCVTNRGTSVFYATCHAYASQRWNGGTPTTPVTGPTTGVLVNFKTQLHLTHGVVAAYQPVVAGTQGTRWGNSS